MTDLFLVSQEGLGVVFQIFMKVVIYLALCSLVLRPPFKHERPPAYVKQCVRKKDDFPTASEIQTD